jgi:CheY-like chemotaxis protein
MVIDITQQFGPDAALMDSAMPEMNGIEITLAMQAEGSHVCVIGLSPGRHGIARPVSRFPWGAQDAELYGRRTPVALVTAG